MNALPHPSKALELRLERYSGQPDGLGALNADQAVQILRQVRKILEKDGLDKHFPSAKFFADWLLHPQLNSPVAMEFLERLNRDVADLGVIELVVPAAVGLIDLRSDLIGIFTQFDLDDALLQTGSLWLRFTSLLLEEIVDVPIIFLKDVGKKGRALEILNRIHSHWIATSDEPASVEPLWFNRLFIELNKENDDFLWRLEATQNNQTVGIRGRLYMVDGGPFRINDLNLATGASPERVAKAVQQVFAERPGDRIFVVDDGSGQAQSEG